MTICTTTVTTPAGDLRVAVLDDDHEPRLVALAFGDHFERVAAPVRERFADERWIEADSDVAEAVRRYVAGDVAALDEVVVDVAGTPFQRRVWDALRSIPVGETWSYAQLAAAVDSPRATRAVGVANGANPVWLVVPCHRVVRSDGSLGGYGGGPDRKEWLLSHEGALGRR